MNIFQKMMQSKFIHSINKLVNYNFLIKNKMKRGNNYGISF